MMKFDNVNKTQDMDDALAEEIALSILSSGYRADLSELYECIEDKLTDKQRAHLDALIVRGLVNLFY